MSGIASVSVFPMVNLIRKCNKVWIEASMQLQTENPVGVCVTILYVKPHYHLCTVGWVCANSTHIFTHRIKDSHRYTHTVTNHANTHTHPLPTHRPHRPHSPPTHQYMQYNMVGTMHLEYALLGSATRLINRITCQPGIPLSFSYSELTALISRSTASALNSGLMKNCEKRSRASSNFSLLTEK